MYKNEVEILQKLLSNRPQCVSPSSPTRLRNRSLSPCVATRANGRRDTATSPVMQLIKRSASSVSTSPTRCTVCGIHRNRSSSAKVIDHSKRILFNNFTSSQDSNSYESQLKNLEEERDRFRRELHKYKRSTKDKVNLDLDLIEISAIFFLLGFSRFSII